MDLTIPTEDTFYIVATDSAADDVTRVLKDGETFAVFNRQGDIQSGEHSQEGLYHEGTRFLAHLLFKLNDARPFLLNSSVTEDNLLFTVNLTNPDVYQAGRIVLPRGTLHVTRTKLLHSATCYETIKFINYGLAPVKFRFALELGADFADVFEVRGMTRKRRGTRGEDGIAAERITFIYDGLDRVRRRTEVHFSSAPDTIHASAAEFSPRLAPKEEREFSVVYACRTDGAEPELNVSRARSEAERALRALQSQDCRVESSNQQFNEWLNRSSADLHMMFSPTPFGFYPYAGVPWFSTPFGRDGIITALEYLWVNPRIARGVLAYLASLQARERDPARDAEPGKILHETRKGEMAALREIPFDLYYGSVDATPLFVLLAGAYLEHTADAEFIRSIAPQIEAALGWIDAYGDRDGDGFVEYARMSSKGLVHQGWKDSWDAVFHADGELAEAPIALSEVQGYVYGAKIAGVAIAALTGDDARARALAAEAAALKEKFHEAFWCEGMSTYALALDGAKRQCQVRASNAGHCLLTGIAGAEQAKRIAQTLMSESSFSGWGVRTVADSEARFNPMAYHNGSVWPHDNALIAAGLARYGFKEQALQILSGLFEASLFVEYRLPELFCGFTRRQGEGPVPYPVACAPQAWAAAAVFLLLQAILGMKIDGARQRLAFVRPVLPAYIDELQIHRLSVGAGAVDLLIRRRARSATVEVERREGAVEVVTEA